jgi:prepilin-type processing-associated H-X9-DG protein
VAQKCTRSSPGFTATEVIVIVVIVALGFLFLLMMVPRGREQARLAACRKNLSQIGFALALYDGTQQHLPMMMAIASTLERSPAKSPSPLLTLLEALQLPDFTELEDSKSPPAAGGGPVPGEIPVPGFVCPSDPNATAGNFPAPISYRATTGDSSSGDNGAFAPGRVTRLKDVEAGDGLAYTAAFAERLVGDNHPSHPAAGNYRIVAGPLAGSGCPAEALPEEWRGDAGRSWIRSDYRSTLYNHALLPGAQPSCLAADGQTAFMGASSGHVRGLNLLFLDGSVTVVLSTIDPHVWREFARINPPQPE